MANRHPNKRYLTVKEAVEIIFESGDELSEEELNEDYVLPPSLERDSDEDSIYPENIDSTSSSADVASLSEDKSPSAESLIEIGAKVITRHGVEWSPLFQW